MMMMKSLLRTKLPQSKYLVDLIQTSFAFRLKSFYDSYHLTDFQKFAVTKFIKQNVGISIFLTRHFPKTFELADRGNDKVVRVRDWLFHKINSQRVGTEFPMQRGCPDIIPGLTARPWW